MCWTILPLTTCFLDNGHFTFQKKLGYAIRYNIVFYIIVGIVALIFLVPLLVLNMRLALFRINDSWKELMPVLVSGGNTWGLIQIVFFLAHGLVQVPKELWVSKDNKTALKCTLHVYIHIVSLAVASRGSMKTARLPKRTSSSWPRSPWI